MEGIMNDEQIKTAKRFLGGIGPYESGLALGYFEKIPQGIKDRVLEEMREKQKELKFRTPICMKKLADWAERGFPYMDEYLASIDFDFFKSVVSRVMGPT